MLKIIRSIVVSAVAVSMSGFAVSADYQNMTLQDAVLIAAANPVAYSPALRDAQATLARYGYYTGPIDGTWGPLTARAVALAGATAGPRLFYVMEQAATSDGQVQAASLLPIQPQEALVPSEVMVYFPHVDRVVPSYFLGASGSRYVLPSIAQEADRFQTVFVDRQSDYRTIVFDRVVPLLELR